MKNEICKKMKKIIALFMALIIAVPVCPVYAADKQAAPEYIYDFGYMKLTCNYTDSGSSTASYHNIWQAYEINSYIGGEHSLLATVRNKYGPSVNGLNIFRGFQDKKFDSVLSKRLVNDYRAGEPVDIYYYYLAEGEVTNKASGAVSWRILAWPYLQGYSGELSITTEKEAADLLALCLGDIDTEMQHYIPETKEDSLKSFKSDFGLARPIWESGNAVYDAWYDSSKEDQEGNIKEDDLITGDAFYWNFGENEKKMFWISLLLGGSGSDNTLFAKDTLENTVVTAGALAGIKNLVTDLKSGSSSDYDPKYGAVGETGITLTTGTKFPIAHNSDYSDPYPTKSNGYYDIYCFLKDFIKGAYGFSYNTKTGESEQVRIKGAIEQIREKMTVSTPTFSGGVGKPSSVRLYGFYFMGSKEGKLVYQRALDYDAILGPEAVIPKDTVNEYLTKGVDKVNIYPVYDVTYDYQRAYGNIEASLKPLSGQSSATGSSSSDSSGMTTLTPDSFTASDNILIINYLTGAGIKKWAELNNVIYKENADGIVVEYEDPLNNATLGDSIKSKAAEEAASGVVDGAKEGAKEGASNGFSEGIEKARQEGKGFFGQAISGFKNAVKGAASGFFGGALKGAAKGAAVGALEGGLEYGNQGNERLMISCEYQINKNTDACDDLIVYYPAKNRGSIADFQADLVRNYEEALELEIPGNPNRVFYDDENEAYIVGPIPENNNYAIVYVPYSREDSIKFIKTLLNNLNK